MCKVQGVCFATCSGVVKVRGGNFGGPDFVTSLVAEGRNIAINSWFVTDLPFPEVEVAVDLGFLTDIISLESEAKREDLSGDIDRYLLVPDRLEEATCESDARCSHPSSPPFPLFLLPSVDFTGDPVCLEVLSSRADCSTSPSDCTKASSIAA